MLIYQHIVYKLHKLYKEINRGNKIWIQCQN